MPAASSRPRPAPRVPRARHPARAPRADVAWLLEVREARRREFGNLLAGSPRVLRITGLDEYHGRRDALAPDAVGQADDGSVLHRGVPPEHVLDLAGRDLVAAALDHVDRLAAEDRHVAVRVSLRHVARQEPTVPE